MKLNLILLFFTLTLLSCQTKIAEESSVIASDIDRFWKAYDTIKTQSVPSVQQKLIEELYIRQASPGLKGMIQAKQYTSGDYIDMINRFPLFLESVKPNTLKAHELSGDLEKGIEKLRLVYPQLKPAKIYFTIGAMRSGGTTMDSLVLIGSELAMVDEQTNILEFEGRSKTWIENYIATKPLENIVLLNVHEYVHTQQQSTPNSLLYQCLYEGVAEFVSTHAMGHPSSSPAIKYGKNNPKVKQVFEEEMFYERTFEWLWSNAPNQFNTRDLGYYIGYGICELYYENAKDKKKAIRNLIELDYMDTDRIDALIDSSRFFSKKISQIKNEDKKKRPRVTGIKEFENGSQNVSHDLESITIEFSEVLNGYSTSIDYGEIGDEGFPEITDRIWSNDSLSWKMKVNLEADKNYQILISGNFRTKEDIPLLPYLIEFKTSK